MLKILALTAFVVLALSAPASAQFTPGPSAWPQNHQTTCTWIGQFWRCW